MTEVKKIAASVIEMAKEVVALKAIAGPGDLDTAQIKPNSEGEWVECPACHGDGMVDAETYVNFDDKPLTVQFYGIGESFGNYQNLFDAGIKHTPALAAALLRAEELLEAHFKRLWEDHLTVANDCGWTHAFCGRCEEDGGSDLGKAATWKDVPHSDDCVYAPARAFLASLKEPQQ